METHKHSYLTSDTTGNAVTHNRVTKKQARPPQIGCFFLLFFIFRYRKFTNNRSNALLIVLGQMKTNKFSQNEYSCLNIYDILVTVKGVKI